MVAAPLEAEVRTAAILVGCECHCIFRLADAKDSYGDAALRCRCRRQLLRKTELNRSQLAAIVESSLDAITGITLDGIIFGWNAAAESR